MLGLLANFTAKLKNIRRIQRYDMLTWFSA